MGLYLNPGNALFLGDLNSQIDVDKSMLISKTDRFIGTSGKYVCVSRPCRFGKERCKMHPCPVSYGELPESEKEYDRRTSQETLKAILALGFKIGRAYDKV